MLPSYAHRLIGNFATSLLKVLARQPKPFASTKSPYTSPDVSSNYILIATASTMSTEDAGPDDTGHKTKRPKQLHNERETFF